MALELRSLTFADEIVVRAADEYSRTEHQRFLVGPGVDGPFDQYLRALEDCASGRAIPEGMVRWAFLVAEVDGQVVGRASLRFELNEFLASDPGHVSYQVLPAFRGLGYATEILRQSLDLLRAEGVDDVLVTCDTDNLASARVIEECGGVFEEIGTSSLDGAPTMRSCSAEDQRLGGME